MPYFKCKKCHHEWESVFSESKCDWCGGSGKILEDQTPLEKFVGESEKILEDLKNTFKK